MEVNKLFNFIKSDNDSDSIYNIWKSQGNEGEQQDFLNSLKGDKGDKGVQGESGAAAKFQLDVIFESLSARPERIETTNNYLDYDELIIAVFSTVGGSQASALYSIPTKEIIQTTKETSLPTHLAKTWCSEFGFNFHITDGHYYIDVRELSGKPHPYHVNRIYGIKYS